MSVFDKKTKKDTILAKAEGAIGVFRKAYSDLNSSQGEIVDLQVENDEKILELEEENNVLDVTLTKNGKILENLGNLLDF